MRSRHRSGLFTTALPKTSEPESVGPFYSRRTELRPPLDPVPVWLLFVREAFTTAVQVIYPNGSSYDLDYEDVERMMTRISRDPEHVLASIRTFSKVVWYSRDDRHEIVKDEEEIMSVTSSAGFLS